MYYNPAAKYFLVFTLTWILSGVTFSYFSKPKPLPDFHEADQQRIDQYSRDLFQCKSELKMVDELFKAADHSATNCIMDRNMCDKELDTCQHKGK